MTAYQPLTPKNKSVPDSAIEQEKCPMVQFVELQRAIAPITQKELTRQLRAFEQRGLVYRKIYAEVPPRVEYEITSLGRTLKPTLDSLAQWMRDHHRELNSGL
ncbi:TPA: helix-turn-helix transcriptional regulator [Yersinia enterocolitica]|nr:helix-turn-helix transcriptional regulator [Yersinia enterocolitica]